MQISSRVDVSGGETVGHHAVPWRWLVPSLVCAAFALQGCDGPPAPSPTSNPHPQNTVKLKITVEKGSEVNRVEVRSLWVVTNLGCAPVIWPAGNTRVKQVDVQEHVEKTGDSYIATIVMDRFLPDNCHWRNGGSDVRYFHNDYRLSSDGVNSNVLRGEKAPDVTCLTSPFVEVGVCGLRNKESFFKSEDKNAFNASVELLK